ncbi:hypothetical protein BGZ97_005667 [Linnemannia gamsii]|uniref:Uncharacterized protein n=1 Tax=Linnemannia gamsii TaxID=64522 RepID=A0A9P6RCN2_9FUNG|nr:hypothetical protein BGZ97_005667 [Linnemannia gamsii]
MPSLMVDTCSENEMVFFLFDLALFMNMESIFQRHLKKITGGQSVPRTVYWSSWVSNTRIESYIAAHRSVENIVNNNEKYDSNEQTVSPNSTTTATTNTTALKIKAKLSYLLAGIVLLVNVYREVKSNYIDYFCFHGPDASGFYLNPANNYISINPEYAAYCYPPDSTLEITLRHYLPFLNTSFPSLSVILVRLSGLLFAIAWSTIPTDVITTAWRQMWNSPSSRLRKIHYILFMLPIKVLAVVLIVRNTPALGDTMFSFVGRSSLIRAEYMMYWSLVFRAAIKLAFGLGFIWNLYVAHSNGHCCITNRLEEKEENEN